MKVKVFLDYILGPSGVERVWFWECPHNGCHMLGKSYNYSNYWETAIRGANHHVKWHKDFYA